MSKIVSKPKESYDTMVSRPSISKPNTAVNGFRIPNIIGGT